MRFAPSTNKERFKTTGLWILDENNQPKRIDVTIGIIDDDTTEITSGDVKEGQQVIVSEIGVMGNVPEFRRRRR